MTWLRNVRAALTLRHRLVLIVVALVALGSVAVGYASVVAVRDQLYSRVDEQLGTAMGRLIGTNPNAPGEAAPSIIDEPGLGAGVLAATFLGGEPVEAVYLDADARSMPVTDRQADVLATALDGESRHTVDLGGDLGSYRIVVVGDDTGVAVAIGTPLRDVATTLSRLGFIIAVVTFVIVGIAALGAYGTIRLALRPLERVASTATAVSDLHLDSGDVRVDVRVPDRDSDGQGEVGRVGAALNRMLRHVSDALSVRQGSEMKLRRFVSDASHELRTPLASISGYAELAQRFRSELPDDVATSLDRIRSESSRMAAIVEDLLLLARLDEGRELAAEPVDVVELAHRAVGDVRAIDDARHYSVRSDSDAAYLLGDEPRLYQVLSNLLANARTHTPASTNVVVRVESSRADDGTRETLLVVEDDGPGIAPELRDHVFERFVRGDGSRSRETGSTGLGLAIVSSIVAAHGGSIGVQSAPGSTRFTLRFPSDEGGEHSPDGTRSAAGS